MGTTKDCIVWEFCSSYLHLSLSWANFALPFLNSPVQEHSEMDIARESNNHSTAIGTFVDGEVLEACDDTCCICLEDFCHSDPSTVTGCKHEFHLHCILEWNRCHRSSNCPMCWQPISLKDR